MFSTAWAVGQLPHPIPSPKKKENIRPLLKDATGQSRPVPSESTVIDVETKGNVYLCGGFSAITDCTHKPLVPV